MRRRLLLAAAVGLVLVGNDPALPAWTASAAGDSGARTAVLAPPTGVSVSRQPTGIGLAWTGSSSTWAGGYRVLRAPTSGGPFTQVAAVAADTTSFLDTTARAGSWHYAMSSTAGSWNASSAAVASADPVYYIRVPSTFSDGQCPTGAATVDLVQGYVAPVGPGNGAGLGTTPSVVMCTDTYSTGQVMPAGTTTVNAYLVNQLAASGNPNKVPDTCTVDLQLLHNGVVIASGSGTVAPGGTAVQAQSWPLASPAVTFATGDRLGLRLVPRAKSPQLGNDCTSTTLYGNGSTVPSNVTFAG